MKIIGYIRVSTDKQDLESQKTGIDKLSMDRGWDITYIEEKASGKISYRDRDLGKLIDTLSTGDILIVSELSRLGRSMIEIMGLIQVLIDRGIKLIAIKGGYEINGSIQSKIITTVLCMVSEIERDLISQRTKEALSKRKSLGQHLGRPFGTLKLRDKKEEILSKFLSGISINELSREYQTSWQTMKNLINS